jgi:hypothetical protein
MPDLLCRAEGGCGGERGGGISKKSKPAERMEKGFHCLIELLSRAVVVCFLFLFGEEALIRAMPLKKELLGKGCWRS